MTTHLKVALLLHATQRTMLPWLAARSIRASRKGMPAGWRAPPTWSARAFSNDGKPTEAQGDSCKSVYITNIDSDSSNAPLLIGLMDYFLRHIPSIGFFQPIGNARTSPGSRTSTPSHADLLHAAFPLKGSPDSSVGITQQEAVTRLAAGQVEDLMEDIYQAYEKYRAGFDAVVMEGATQEMIGSNFMEVNAEVGCCMDLRATTHRTRLRPRSMRRW